MRLGLGEGGVVAAGAADQGAAGAAAAGRQQVAVAFAVEEGRAGQAADQAVGAGAAVELVGAGAGLDQVVLGAGVDLVVAAAAGEAELPTASSEPWTRSLSAPGPRSAISQRPGPPAGQETVVLCLARTLSVAGGKTQPGPAASEPDRGDAEGARGFVEGDPEVVAAAAADDLQAGAATRARVEFYVGGAPRRFFLAAGDRGALRTFAAVAALAAVERVGSAAAGQMVVAGPAVDHVALAVAEQGVAEGGAFDALEAEQLVVAVAVGAVLGQRGPDAGAVGGGDVGREGGDVALAGAAGHAVPAVVAVDQVFVAGTAVDDVDAEVAGDLVVVAGAAHHLVVAEVADHPVVVAGAAVDLVVAAAAVDHVGAGPAADQVVAEAAEDRVVALAAPDHVAPGGAVDHVVAVGADDLRLAPVADRRFDRRVRGRARRRRPRRRRPGPPARQGFRSAASSGGDQALRINFLLTNSSAPKRPSSRPKPERLKPPKGSSGLSAPTRLT